MMNYFKKLHFFLIGTNKRLTFLILFAAVFLVSFLFNFLVEIFDLKYSTDNYRFYDDALSLFFFAVILAPIIETFIFQYLIFKLTKKLSPFIYALLSALAFGFAHYHKNSSFVEVIDVFLTGLIFAYAYYLYILKNESSFWYVVLLHMFVNLKIILVYLSLNYFGLW